MAWAYVMFIGVLALMLFLGGVLEELALAKMERETEASHERVSRGIDRLRSENAVLREVLGNLEWSGTTYGPRARALPACPCCRGVDERSLEPGEVLPTWLARGHEADCRLAAVVGRKDPTPDVTG